MLPREPLLWRLLARLVSSSPIRGWLIRRAMRTPYLHLRTRGADEIYMERWWLFNPYDRAYRGRWAKWLPSIRVHHIQQPDPAPHPHDHPWRARTIILSGGYGEQRYGRPLSMWYGRGDTYALRPGLDFHNIYALSEGGCWTLFITWPLRGGEYSDGEWGFLVEGEKIHHLDYKAQMWDRVAR